MGNWGSQIKIKYKVLTLNYSGILESPFEFYSNQMEKSQTALSSTFHEILKATEKGFDVKIFKWNIGKIDQKMQKDRYSPCYRPDAGILNGKIMNEKQFCDEWEAVFEKNIGKYAGQLKYTPEEKEAVKVFDLTCFKAIVAVSSNKKAEQVLELKPEQYSIQGYRKLMATFFGKNFLDQDRKIKKTIISLEKQSIDIAFIQEASNRLLKALSELKTYQIIHEQNKQSVILVNLQKFPNKEIQDHHSMLSAIEPNLVEQFNWNNDTVMCFFGNLVLFSAHLSSKKQKNGQQVAQMMKTVSRLKTIYPEKEVIIGADCNSFVKFPVQGFQIYPNMEIEYTTYKKRTFLQPQIIKAEESVLVCRDHLITTLAMNNARVTTIQGLKNDVLIPTQSHPYDHFVVAASLIDKKLE